MNNQFVACSQNILNSNTKTNKATEEIYKNQCYVPCQKNQALQDLNKLPVEITKLGNLEGFVSLTSIMLYYLHFFVIKIYKCLFIEKQLRTPSLYWLKYLIPRSETEIEICYQEVNQMFAIFAGYHHYFVLKTITSQAGFV